MYRMGPVNFYKHIATRRYLLLDDDGNSFRQTAAGLVPISFEYSLLEIFG